MLNRFIKQLFLIVVSMVALVGNAQERYYAEVGLLGGGAFYLGDANSTLFKGTGPNLGVLGKYKFNNYWALGAEVSLGKVSFEEPTSQTLSGNRFWDVSITGEFNFFNLGGKRHEEYRSRVSPYLLGGVGFTMHTYGLDFNIPFGLGVKWLVSDRINLGAKWMMHKNFSDTFDNLDNPLGLNGNVFANRDWYSTATVYLTVNIVKVCKPCRNGINR